LILQHLCDQISTLFLNKCPISENFQGLIFPSPKIKTSGNPDLEIGLVGLDWLLIMGCNGKVAYQPTVQNGLISPTLPEAIKQLEIWNKL